MSQAPGPRWGRLCAALLLFAACRGLALLCVLPPGEGWDEYQHLAYLVHWLDTGERPRHGSVVPHRLLMELQAWPQPEPALEPFRARGMSWPRGYAEHWSQPPLLSAEASPPILLYEAQQGDLYYALVAPLFRRAGDVGALERSVSLLRALNLLAQLGALALLLAAIGRLAGDRPAAVPLALVVATQPLPLLNAARVSSDAFGVLAATAAIVVGLALPRRASAYAGLGIALGVAIRLKAAHYALAPFLLACVFAAGRRYAARGSWLLVRATLLLAVATLLAAPEIEFNLRHHGSISGMQEAIQNREAGRSFRDLAPAMVSALGQQWRTLGRDGLFVGGWSFVLPPRVLGWLYFAALTAGLLAGAAKTRSWLRGAGGFVAPQVVPLAILLVCSYAAAMAYHMGHFSLAHGGSWPSTPWYAAAATPWLLVLAVSGAAAWGHRPALLVAGLLVAAHLGCELATLPAMARHYAGGAGGSLMLQRLAGLHPGWLGTPSLALAAAGALTSLGASLWLAWGVGLRPRPRGGVVPSGSVRGA